MQISRFQIQNDNMSTIINFTIKRRQTVINQTTIKMLACLINKCKQVIVSHSSFTQYPFLLVADLFLVRLYFCAWHPHPRCFLCHTLTSWTSPQGFVESSPLQGLLSANCEFWLSCGNKLGTSGANQNYFTAHFQFLKCNLWQNVKVICIINIYQMLDHRQIISYR